MKVHPDTDSIETESTTQSEQASGQVQVVSQHKLPVWTWVAPMAAWAMLGLLIQFPGGWMAVLSALVLAGAVMASVHHAEVIAHRVGEPFGSLLLALAVTIIELSLVMSLMIAGGERTATLARDTVFAAVMIIINGMVGICLLLGAQRHHEQRFSMYGVNASLATLATIAVLTMVLPNYTSSIPGPFYSNSQLIFIAVVSLVLYGAFVLVQTSRHRDYFLPEDADTNDEAHNAPPSNMVALLSLVLLLVCLGAVVLLAKGLTPYTEKLIVEMGAPKSAVGILIALVVLLPEGLAAVRAARANRLQTSMNLALGSALASIGLTIPAVAVLSVMLSLPAALGIDAKSIVLLSLSLLVATLSLGKGRTTVLQGVVHLVLFAVYLFTSIVP